MLLYATKLDQGTASLENQSIEAQSMSYTLDYTEPLPRGWALQSSAAQKNTAHCKSKELPYQGFRYR